MADAKDDIEQLNAALAAMAERAADDPAYRESLKANQVETLLDAGISVLVLSGVFEELGAESEEVAAYGMDLGAPHPSGGGQDYLLCTRPVGTCKKVTIVINSGGCTKSI